jgi:ubiquinone/menaquinone biosynthesis C-methylase UbiE
MTVANQYSQKHSNPEHMRLEIQANLLRELMNGEVIHAPLDPTSAHKALDMGCGTGTVTKDIAFKFPKARVYGLDLSPIPAIGGKFPDVEYIQGDFNELSDPSTRDPRFEDESFDLIFSRLLIMGMTNWKGYIERCVALTKPGVRIHATSLATYDMYVL